MYLTFNQFRRLLLAELRYALKVGIGDGAQMKVGFSKNSDGLRLALQAGVSGAFAYLFSQWLGLDASSWAVISALFVLHPNVDATLGSAGMRLLAAALGTTVGLALVQLFQGESATTLRIALGAGLVMLAAARWPNLRYGVVPVTILALSPGAGISEGALMRAAAISVGTTVGLLAALMVFPDSARRRALDSIAAAVDDSRELLDRAFRNIFDQTGQSLNECHRSFYRNVEAARPLVNQMRLPGDAPDKFQELLHQLERLWHTLVVLDRTMMDRDVRLRNEDLQAIRPAMAKVRKRATRCLRSLGDSLRGRGPIPSADDLRQLVKETDCEAEGALQRVRPERSEASQGVQVLLFGFREVGNNVAALPSKLKAVSGQGCGSPRRSRLHVMSHALYHRFSSSLPGNLRGRSAAE